MALIITLIVLGIVLIIAEILIIPGFAVIGILGLCSLVASCYFGFANYGETGGIITIAVNIVLLIFFVIFSLKSKTWKKLSLSTNIDSKVDTKPQEKGITPGTEGITITRLNPMGRARINDLDVEVRSIDGIIDPNETIVVAYLEDERILIKKK
ncbi:MAG: nodulation efficiency protein D (NfeD) [Bacteroidales bacterium]|nr:nodulation efficiency protein D (NfeD) [Bacteroidales bacterium]MDD4670671.1 nodulation efficiency protein D (NfeD) [Bacteroidales bacterium]